MSGCRAELRAVEISIAVAAHHDAAALARCLAALDREAAANPSVEIEIVVASALPAAQTAGRIARRAGMVWIEAGAGASVPELRAAGLRVARGELVALLEDHLRPRPGWLAALRRAHRDAPERLAIGGAVDPGGGDRPIDRAAYFCEYGWHMSPLRRGEVQLLTGANVSYKRAAVELFRSLAPAWETEWHRALRAAGHALAAEPDMIVEHDRRFSAWDFARERVRYGRGYARERSKGMAPAERVARAASAPLLPFVLTARLGASVLAKRRERRSFVRSIAWTFVFFAAWAAGEAQGYLRGRRGEGR